MIVYQREKLVDVMEEAKPLLLRHWHEIALDQSTVPLDPDWDMYCKIELLGQFNLTTARIGVNGELIGYAAFFIVPNFHYRSLRVAENDIFWLAPEHRIGRVGIRLIQAAEQNCRAVGANKIVIKEKVHHSLGKLFERLGYRCIERIHAKTVL